MRERIYLALASLFLTSLVTANILGITKFIEFSLEMVMKSLEDFIAVFRPKTTTPADRLENAHKQFGDKSFSRKDFLELYKSISTATASRDLKVGVDKELLEKTGDKAVTLYRFYSI